MPIYGYRCAACGHQKDVLQKMSDSPLTECPVCGEASFSKEVSAPAFQLKGTGWYVTDFRDNNKDGKSESKSADTKSGDSQAGDSKTADSKAGDAKSADTKPASAADGSGAVAKPAPAPAPAATPAASSSTTPKS